MAQITVPTIEKSTRAAAVTRTARLFFVDHLRAALIILVVLHHLAVVYVAATPFYYIDPPQTESLGGLVLFVFTLMNQAWFMGAFFLLAGYFTVGSYDRKGPGAFLKDRLIRLGIPLLAFMFVLGPLSDMGLYLDPAPLIMEPLTWQSFARLYPAFIGLGPLWFVALLLIFSFGYAGWRMLTANRSAAPAGEPALPGYRAIALFILALALASYLMRIVIPMGREVLGFPTLSYLPQYLSFFVVGALASRGDWLRALPDRLGKVGFVTAVVATLLLFPIIILGILGGTFRFLGNGSWPSAVYTLWDSAFAVGMTLAAITFFRRYFGAESRLGSFLSQQSYAVFITHSPIIVVLAYGLYLAYTALGVSPGPLVRFSIATVIVVPVCFIAAYLIRKIPGVARVL